MTQCNAAEPDRRAPPKCGRRQEAASRALKHLMSCTINCPIHPGNRVFARGITAFNGNLHPAERLRVLNYPVRSPEVVPPVEVVDLVGNAARGSRHKRAGHCSAGDESWRGGRGMLVTGNRERASVLRRRPLPSSSLLRGCPSAMFRPGSSMPSLPCGGWRCS